MKHLITFENYQVDNKKFGLKKGSKIIYKGGELEVIEIYDTAFKAKNDKGWTGTINYNQFDEGGRIISL
jgi:hypothetical protein